MSNIDKRALREAANAANAASWGNWEPYKPHKGARGYEVKVGVKAVAQHCLKVDSVFIAAANPATVLALLDELESAEKRIAELESERDKQGRRACELFDEVAFQRQQIAELVAAGIITKVGGGRDMKIGDHMQEVVGLVNDLTGYETESALKLLALVVGEYMINADATEVNINAGVMSIKVEITVPGEE